jgi:hypothetical protein
MRLADEQQVGGLFGLLEAVENVAGLVGPPLGGVLHRRGEYVPLLAVVVLYAIVLVAVMGWFRKHVVRAGAEMMVSSKHQALCDDDDTMAL